MTTTTQIERYTDFLRELEITSRPDADVLHFEHEGLHFVLYADEGDPNYFRLELPGIWRAGSVQEHLLGLAVASEVTRTTKAVKLSFQGPIASASVECFEPTPEAFRAIFLRALQALIFGAQSFRHHTGAALASTQAPRRMGFGGAGN